MGLRSFHFGLLNLISELLVAAGDVLIIHLLLTITAPLNLGTMCLPYHYGMDSLEIPSILIVQKS